jgi:polysaccharide biosynthesis transport protein
MTEYDQTGRPDFRAAVDVVRRRWKVVLPFLLIPIAALGFSLSQEKQYSASASLLFRDTDNIASELAEREAATNVEVLSLDQIERAVNRRLGVRGPIAEDVKFEQEGVANIITITATDPSPARAADTANAYAQEYVAFRRRTSLREIRADQRFIRAELKRLGGGLAGRDRERSLRSRLRRLSFDTSQERGPARVVSAATPPGSPSSPKPVRNTVLGGAAALLLAILAVVLFERLDPRLNTPKEVEGTLDKPILGLVRKSRALARSPARIPLPHADLDAFLALRAHLRYMDSGRSIRSVLVTSSATGDGKTTVAWNLASAAAGRDTGVLLVEADLRNPTLAQELRVDPELSLASVLDGKATLAQVTQEVALPNVGNGRAPSIVAVVHAGTTPTRSTDPIQWERLSLALQEAERDFDLIVIDTAPILLVPDAIPLLSQVDGVIVVGRLGRTPRAALARLKEELDTVGAQTLGAVVNSVGNDPIYGYGYGQGQSYGTDIRHK